MADRICSVVDYYKQAPKGLKGTSKSGTQKWKEECWKYPNHGGEEAGELVTECKKNIYVILYIIYMSYISFISIRGRESKITVVVMRLLTSLSSFSTSINIVLALAQNTLLLKVDTDILLNRGK